MEFHDFENKKKKKLDFSRPTYDEREFKIPCREITNQIENETNLVESEVSCEKTLYADDEYESSRGSDALSIAAERKETVSVHLRLKPTEERIPEDYFIDESNVILKGNNQRGTATKYTFTSILDQVTDQKTVYSKCILPVLSDPFSSTGAVFASYGVSNSGKTYTIIGEKSCAGIVPRALFQIFAEYNQLISELPCVKLVNDKISILEDDQVTSEIEATKTFVIESQKSLKAKLKSSWINDVANDHHFESIECSEDFHKVYIWISFVEIYNEMMNDLLKMPSTRGGARNTSQRPLKIISNNRHSYIQGLTSLYVSSLEEAIEILQLGLRNVNYAATGVNNHSSRSHTVFTISMIKDCDSSFTYSSFKFCDLAGAERSKKTGNIGERLKESGGINASLSVLGKCLEAVQTNQKLGFKKQIVPVRESKLTFLIQSSLVGQEKFVMIVNLSPSIECFYENINVLHFGSIANKIITRRAEARKLSARFSYFRNSPKAKNSSVYFNESVDRNESSLDSSYERSLMTKEELLQMLHKKEIECDYLRKTIETNEREFLVMKRELVQQNQATVDLMVNNEKAFSDERDQIRSSYWKKKIDSLIQKHEKQIEEWAEDNDLLERENRKLKAMLKLTDDGDIIDLDESVDDETESEEDSNNEKV